MESRVQNLVVFLIINQKPIRTKHEITNLLYFKNKEHKTV